jgi:hypothetical protein
VTATVRVPRFAPNRWSGRHALTVLVLVLVLVATVAAVLGALAARAITAPKVPAAFASMPVLRTVQVGVLDRPQTATDRLDVPRGGGFVAASVRRIAVMPNVPSVISAARNAAGDVCLVTAVKQGRQYSASCVPPAVFARDGVSLQWSLSGWSAGEAFVEQGYLPRFFVVAWGPDGGLRYRTHVVGEG